MGKRESIPDVARNLSRWVDGVAAACSRTRRSKGSLHDLLDQTAKGSIPVVLSQRPRLWLAEVPSRK